MWENQILQVEYICNRVEELEQRNGPSSEDSTPTNLVPEFRSGKIEKCVCTSIDEILS